MIRKSVTIFAGLAVLLGMSSAAMAAPDINNTTWAGWTDKGSSIATGVWARNPKTQDYQIFVTTFTSSGPSQIPGTSSGFTAGNRILGIGVRNNSGATGSPSIKLDPDNNSYAPSPDGIVNGQSSFSSNGDLGDPIVNSSAGNPTEITIRSANPYVASNDYYCPNGGNWCQGLGQPGFRGINPGTGVWKVFFDLDQMTTEFGPGGTRNILGKPTLDAGAFATGSTIKIAIGGLGGTEAVVAAVISDCGDGIIQGSEECDDGNLAYGDACTPSCVTVVESNFTVNTITPVYGTPSGNQVTGVEADAAPGFPSGSLASNGIAKTDLYLTPAALFGGPVTLGEIVSIRYWTKKGTTHTVSAPDWYMLIYTNPFPGDVSIPGWYGDRIGTEPYFSASLVDPANTWNQFTTDGATNKLRFFQSTAGAPGASFGSYSDPHWDTFVAGNSLGTSSPLAGHSILYFSIQTGSAWAAGFTGQIDGLRIETTGGKVANVNFEFTCTTDSQCDTGICATDTCNIVDGTCSSTFVSAGTECRASAGVCDTSETCTGSSAACPADAFLSSSTVCRADAGQCDVAENCTGSAAACPADAFEPNTTACTGSSQTGVCDDNAADRCSGAANTCVDGYKSAATVCRTDSGECDVAENCTGSTAACPADAFEPSGTACGSALDDQCTNPDTCNGANSCLPNHEPLGTVCDDERICTINDACDGGGECDANATLFKDTCTYFAVGARSGGRILGHIGNNGAVTGDLCFDRSKVFAFTALTGNLVATASTGGKAHRFGEGSSITGDVVTDGAGVFSIKGALLPHVTPGVTSLAGGTVTAKDAVPGGFYNLSGTAPLVDSCVTARADLLAAATTIAGLTATQSHGDTTIAAGDTLTLAPTVPGGLNVIDYARIRGGSDVTINIDGGGNADTIVILRVASRFQLRENSVIQMTNGMQAKNFVLYVARGRTDIGNFSTVAGTIYGRGFVRLGEDVIVDGQVFGSGGKLEINAGVLATLEPNEIVLP